MAAKICLEHLSLVDDGFRLAGEAARRAELQHSNVLSRCHNLFCVSTETFLYRYRSGKKCYIDVFFLLDLT